MENDTDAVVKRQMAEHVSPEAEGQVNARVWRRVRGHSRNGYPPFITALRLLGGLAYLLAAGDRRTGLLAYRLVAPGRLSRSGQPHLVGFRHLRARGVNAIVNLRMGQNDPSILRQLGFRAYLHLPIPDGLPPTDAQADAFLRFAADPNNWVVHVHCLRGVQRTGTLVALYRYAIEGKPVEEALREANSFFPHLTSFQVAWLRQWAARHAPGEYRPRCRQAS